MEAPDTLADLENYLDNWWTYLVDMNRYPESR